MISLFLLVCSLGLAELLRRCCLALLAAFTGPLSKIPGPLLMKVSGLPWLITSMTGNQLNLLPRLIESYGNTVRISPKTVVVSGKAAVYKVVVEEDLAKSPGYELLRTERHVTTLFTERDKAAYKQKRRLISPGFLPSYLDGLEPLMLECVQALRETLDSMLAESQGVATVNVLSLMTNVTTDVMGATSFGGSFNSTRNHDPQYNQAFHTSLKRSALYSQLPFLRWLPFMPSVDPPGFKQMIDDIIKRRQAVPKEERTKDLLQILLDIHEQNPSIFTVSHLREEMRLFVIAGSDTTSTGIIFTLLLLLNNPQKLAKLVTEIDEAFPTASKKTSFESTRNLAYLNAVINESGRLMPIPALGIGRYATQGTTLNGYEIPSGTTVVAHSPSVQRDPEIWPDADQFIPERWLGEYKGASADRKAFYPFSGGSRVCIGQQFALKEMRLIFVTLLRHYELSLVPGQSHELRLAIVTTFVAGKYLVRFKHRSISC